MSKRFRREPIALRTPPVPQETLRAPIRVPSEPQRTIPPAEGAPNEDQIPTAGLRGVTPTGSDWLVVESGVEHLAPFLPRIEIPRSWQDPSEGWVPLDPVAPLWPLSVENESSRAFAIAAFGPSRYDDAGDPWITHPWDLEAWMAKATPADLLRVFSNPGRGLELGMHPLLAARSGLDLPGMDTWDNVPPGHRSVPDAREHDFPWEPGPFGYSRAMQLEEWMRDLPGLSPALLISAWRELPPSCWSTMLSTIAGRLRDAGSGAFDPTSPAAQPLIATVALLVQITFHRARLSDVLEDSRGGLDTVLRLITNSPLMQTDEGLAWRDDMLALLLGDAPSSIPQTERVYWQHFVSAACRYATLLVCRTTPNPPTPEALADQQRLERQWRARATHEGLQFSCADAVSSAVADVGPRGLLGFSPWALGWLLGTAAKPSRRRSIGDRLISLGEAMEGHPGFSQPLRGRWRSLVLREILNLERHGPWTRFRVSPPVLGTPGVGVAADDDDDGFGFEHRGSRLLARSLASRSPAATAQWLRRRLTALMGCRTWAEVLAHPKQGVRAQYVLAHFSDEVLRALGKPTWSVLLRNPEREWRVHWIQRAPTWGLSAPAPRQGAVAASSLPDEADQGSVRS